MCKPYQVEHEAGWQNTGSNVPGLLGRTLDTIADWTCFNTGITFDAF